MTVKCIFCNDTKIEPGIPGPCVWCETAAESIKFGTGIMLVGADGAKNVPLGDVLIETKAFRLLPYGTKFRYQGTQDVWVRIGHNLIAKWPCDLFGRDGQPCQSLCSFCHLESDDSGDTLDTLVEVVDSDMALIADRDAALGREGALREELDQCGSMASMIEGKEWAEHAGSGPVSSRVESAFTQLHNELAALRESYESMRDRKNSIVDLQQRLTVAEQRAEDLKKLLCDVINESPTGFAALKVDLANRVNDALKQTEEGEGS